MDFELSADQEDLREAAAGLLDGLSSSTHVRAHLASGEPFDRRLWDAMVEQGWLGVDVSEDAGGLGLGFVEATVLMEEVGRHVAPAPFQQTMLAIGATGDDALLNGAVGAVGWSDGRAERVLVPYAPVADVIVVATPTAVLRVEGPPAAESAMDLTRCVGWVDVAGASEIGGPDEARALLDRGAVATSAESLGAASRVLDLSVQHAKTRIQFGKPIGSFQAVKHRCADMLVDLEGMRSTTYHAAWSIAAGDPDASVAASTAKTWCADAARRIMASGLQVHGGIGFTWEHDLHLYLKRAQLDQVSFGDATVHRERLGALLREKVTAGLPIL